MSFGRLGKENAIEEADTILKLAASEGIVKAADYLDRLCQEQYDAGYGACEDSLRSASVIRIRSRRRDDDLGGDAA